MTENPEKPFQLVIGGSNPQSPLLSRDQTMPECFATIDGAIQSAKRRVSWPAPVGYEPACSLTDLRTGLVCRKPWEKQQVLHDLNLPFELAIGSVNLNGKQVVIDPPRYFASKEEAVEGIYDRALELDKQDIAITHCSIKQWQLEAGNE